MLKDKIKYRQLSHDNKIHYSLDLSFSFDDYDWCEHSLSFKEHRLLDDKFVTALIILNEMRNYNLYDLNWDLFDYLVQFFNFKNISPGERPYGISDFIFERHVEENGKLHNDEVIMPSLKEVFDEIPEDIKEFFGLISDDLTKNNFKI